MSLKNHRLEAGGWLLTSPYLLFTLVFFLLPLVWGIFIVFTNWNMIAAESDFVGVANFVEALGSRRVHAAFFTSYKFMGIFLITVIPVSLGIALLINCFSPRVKGLLCVAFFLPHLVSEVAAALVVRGVLSYVSPVSTMFRHVLGYVPNWLGNPILATVIISLMITWKCSGYYALIFLSALQAIPKELYEAGSIDGATSWTRFWRITVPMLYPAFYTVMILAVGLMFHVFSEPYMLTDGGPKLATHTWFLEIYYQAFQSNRAGYASTVALLNAVATFVSIIGIRKLMERWGRSHGWT